MVLTGWGDSAVGREHLLGAGDRFLWQGECEDRPCIRPAVDGQPDRELGVVENHGQQQCINILPVLAVKTDKAEQSKCCVEAQCIHPFLCGFRAVDGEDFTPQLNGYHWWGRDRQKVIFEWQCKEMPRWLVIVFG